jgi:hypothetical protein
MWRACAPESQGDCDLGLLAKLPVTRSSAACALFIGSAGVTILLMLWTNDLGTGRAVRDLSPIFAFLFSYYDYQGAVGLLLILLCALLTPARFPSRLILRWIGEHTMLIAFVSVAILCTGALLVYRDHPLAMDEYSQYFQSQVFAAGHLAGRFPVPLIDWLIPRPFQNYFLFVSRQTGAVAEGYWPSFSLLLTPFTLFGIPWACNPIISGATLIVMSRLAMAIFDDVEAAGAAVLLTIASPVFFANGISYYSMPAHLLANSWYALLLLNPTTKRAFAAGVVGSIALTLHNPVPHMLFAAPWWLWIAKRADAPRLVGASILGYIPLCLVLGVGWFNFCSGLAHEGATSVTGSHDSMGGLARIASSFSLPSSSVWLARAIGVAKAWLWAVPGLILLAAVGAWKWRANPACRLLTMCALVTLAGYVIVPFDQGHGWGYRYFHSAWMALPLLAAGAMTRKKPGDGQWSRIESEEFRAFVVGCALLSLIIGVGQRVQQMQEFIAADLRHLPAQRCLGRCVLFLDPSAASYELDLVQNDPWLRGNAIRMVSAGSEANARLMSQQFPDMLRFTRGRFGEGWTAQSAPHP